MSVTTFKHHITQSSSRVRASSHMSHEPRNYFSPVSEMRLRPKIVETSSGAKFEKLSKDGEITKILTFAPIIASASLKTVSRQLNGILMMWKIQQAML